MITRANYFAKLQEAAVSVTAVLKGKGVATERLAFGGEGILPKKKPWVPPGANSNFLGNRAMGDWAESMLKDLLKDNFSGFKPLHYGDANETAADEEDFKDYYRGELEATRIFGKRPDLLLFPNASAPQDDFFRAKTVSESEKEARHAVAAIEVRSSKLKALHYMGVREQERLAGSKKARACPSFTVKVEDLIIVYRWMERFAVPECYAQVFFDSVYGINFLRIFEIIGSGVGFTIEKPKESLEKVTIMIPITSGHQIASCFEPPNFKTVVRETRLGRVDAFVAPVGGKFTLDPAALNAVLFPQAGTETGK